MTALADANIKEVDKFIREALEAALERGALPGEREGLDEHGIAAAAAFLGRTANGRKPGEAAIMVETLGEGANGRYMRIAIVNDDMPFLVDSIANALAAADKIGYPCMTRSAFALGGLGGWFKRSRRRLGWDVT